MIRSCLLLVVGIAVCLTCQCAHAATVRFVGATGGRINLDIEKGSYPDLRVVLTPTVTIDVSVDPVASTIFFHKVEFSLPAFQTVQTKSFLVPGSFTELRTITTTLKFDEFRVAATDVGPLSLSANVGTQFELEEYLGDHRGGFTAANVSGTYLVEGPTQSASGPFALVFPAVGSGPRFVTDHSMLNVGNFPASIHLDLNTRADLVNFQPEHGYLDVFSGAVDLIPIDVKMLRLELAAEALTLSEVPEPGALGLTALALIAGARCLRRRRGPQNRR